MGWLAIIGATAGTIGGAFLPTRVPGAVNPLAPNGPPPAAELLHGLGVLITMGALAAAGLSLFVRYRRSSGIERQQLKWLAFGAILVGIAVSIYTVSIPITGDAYNPSSLLLGGALLFVPVAMALAMLRYGLYEIDRVLNRTTVYAVVTVLLLALYTGSMLSLQAGLASVTGGDTLAVAASTLIVAAIFQPIRYRSGRDARSSTAGC